MYQKISLAPLNPAGFVQVMENLESHGIFKNFIFQAWEVKEFNGRSLKIMENYSFVSTVV